MSNDNRDTGNVPADVEACYEARASQEEFYLEEEEEEVRAILIFTDESSPSQDSATSNPCDVQSREDQLEHAAEELITGDSDDPPLSEQQVEDLLSATSNQEETGHTEADTTRRAA